MQAEVDGVVTRQASGAFRLALRDGTMHVRLTLGVNGLSKAIEQRDTARLERYVDFPRVRSSLRAYSRRLRIR